MRIHLSNTAFAVLALLLTGIAELCSCRNNSTFVRCIERERQVLLDFKRSLTLDFASASQKLSSWEGHDCCQWEGIECSNVSGHVVKLDLKDPCSPFTDSSPEQELLYAYGAMFTNCPDLAHAQHVSPSLSQLEYLNYLDLSRIVIEESPFPTFFGSMQRLRHLSLRGYGLRVMVPSTLANLTHLHVLCLINLGYSKDISWLARLSSLQYLGMKGVHLGGAHDLFQVLNMLPSLLHIHLTSCDLGYMPILSYPVNLTNLSRVQVLNLANNGLEDSFLDAFQNMTSIRDLGISSNFLNSVPPWLAKNKKLVRLDVSGAFDNPVLDPLRNMTSIKVLDLTSCNLTSLPLWFSQFNNLELSLRDNGFFGQLPYALQNMTSIRVLDCSDNNITSVPLWLSEFENLIGLDLSGNLLYGPISNALRNLTSLTFLDLSGNSITSLPLWLSELKCLVQLHLSRNNFTYLEEGSLSSILRNLCHLKQFDLISSNGRGLALQSNEYLHGCTSYDLELLDLSGNEFGGSLPSWLGQFKNLKRRLLDSNSFFGPIPSSLENLTNLTELRLGGNMLNGCIPHSLAQLVNLEYLELSSNHFGGVIPQSLFQLKNLFVLDLSSNYLKGTLTDLKASPQMMSLSYFNLSYNQITGSLPKSLGEKMPKLRFLLLHNNLINGSIPSSLGKIKTLYCFDVSSNRLSGNIPSTLWNLPSLVWLHLNNNSFHGKLSSSLTNMTNLIILDLGENRLSGVIPSWNGSTFPHLQILRMRRNMFSGSIPSSLCQFDALQILDLADNNILGSIPQCISNNRGMVSRYISDWDPLASNYFTTDEWQFEDVKQVIKGRELDYIRNLRYVVNLDLSNNYLFGSIPDEICSFSGLIGLNLSYNHLSGKIPAMIGEMKSLESIDFSHNQLCGVIPRSMSALPWLSHLNLSYNNLSGAIPNENQFQVLNDPLSYTGNRYLCGVPLQKLCPEDESHQAHHNNGNEDEIGEKDELDKVWFYLVIALGFATGFWGFIGVLLMKKNWRHAYFGYVDKVADRIYIAVILRAAKLKKRMQRNGADE